MQDLAARMNSRYIPAAASTVAERHVLEFERDNIDALGEPAYLVEVVIFSAGVDISDLAGRRVRVRRIRMYAIAHLAGLDRKHASELAAAKTPMVDPGRTVLFTIRKLELLVKRID